MPSKARHFTAESSLDTKPQVNLKALPPRCNSKTSTSPHHLVLDLSLPSHIVNDRSLFTTYTSSRKLHRTIFGNDIIIEGYGDVHVRTFAGTKSILFRLTDCWHVPSSPHHFLSCKRVISQGKQVMLAGRIPRMIHSHKDRLAEPQLPKYVPFTRDGGVFVLEFQIPGPVEVSGIQPNATPLFSLHASSFRSFAGMAACASAPVPSMYQLQPSAALSLHHPNLPLLSPVTVNFQSATIVSMLSQYNVLLDSRCARHIVRDRRLFCSYTSTEKPMSVDTANCGSLEVLGIGDVEFRCPFRDGYVVFTMRGCLYAPKAPINLLSVGTLVERGMSCLFSSGGLTKVFYPQNHAKLPGFTFSAVVMNRLSFLKLVFLSPVDSMSPKYMPFEQASSSSYHPFAGLAFSQPLPTQPPSPQRPTFPFSSSSVGASVGDVSHGGEDCGDHDGLVDEVHEDYIGLNDDANSTSHGGANDRMTSMDVMTEAELEDRDTKNQVASTTSGGDPNNQLKAAQLGVGENFIARLFTFRPSIHFLPYISSLTSPLNSNNTTCLLYSPLPLSYNNFPLHFSPLSTLNPFFPPVYSYFEVSLPHMNPSPATNSSHSFSPFRFRLPTMSAQGCRSSCCPLTSARPLDDDHPKIPSVSTIIFPLKCSCATPTYGQCHSPSPIQTNPAIPYKLPLAVPDVIPLARSHIVAVSNSDWSTHKRHHCIRMHLCFNSNTKDWAFVT